VYKKWNGFFRNASVRRHISVVRNGSKYRTGVIESDSVLVGNILG